MKKKMKNKLLMLMLVVLYLVCFVFSEETSCESDNVDVKTDTNEPDVVETKEDTDNVDNMIDSIKKNCPVNVDEFFMEQYAEINTAYQEFDIYGCDSENEILKGFCSLPEFDTYGAHLLLNMTKLDLQKLELLNRKFC